MKLIKDLMKILPAKPMVLLSILFIFVFTLGGCSNESPYIQIRSIHNMPDNVVEDAQCPNTACWLALIEAQPVINDTASLSKDYSLVEEDYYGLFGNFYATFNTGRAPVGAISWTITIDNLPVNNATSDVWVSYDTSGIVDVYFGGSFPPQVVRLTAHAEGIQNRTIVLIAPSPRSGTDEPVWSNQRQ